MPGDRAGSGIPGLDKYLSGGFPQGSVMLLSGAPGTGKTIFGLQYAYYGARNKEPALYVSFEQTVESLKDTAKKLGMDVDKMEKEKKMRIVRISDPSDIGEVLEAIRNEIRKLKAKRLVIDSISVIEIFLTSYRSVIKDLPPEALGNPELVMIYPKGLIRRMIYRIMDFLHELGTTTLLIAQEDESGEHAVAKYAADGVIKLEMEVLGRMLQRTLSIIKMRDTPIDGGRYEMEITNRGIKLID